jgi:hypothetical protein
MDKRASQYIAKMFKEAYALLKTADNEFYNGHVVTALDKMEVMDATTLAINGMTPCGRSWGARKAEIDALMARAQKNGGKLTDVDANRYAQIEGNYNIRVTVTADGNFTTSVTLGTGIGPESMMKEGIWQKWINDIKTTLPGLLKQALAAGSMKLDPANKTPVTAEILPKWDAS